MPLATFLIKPLLADPPDVRHIIRGCNHGVAGWVVVPLIQTEVLWLPVGRLGSVHHNRFDGPLEKFGVMHVGPCNHDTQRTPIGLND
jgi:hypothetical protein